MHRHAGHALLALLLAPAGCFYTTSINERPRADIESEGLGPYFPGDTVWLSAYRSYDAEDGGDVSCSWTANRCDDDRCQETVQIDAAEGAPCGDSFGFALERGSHRPVLVRLTVEDSEGAPFHDEEIIEVGNHAPLLEGPQPTYLGSADHASVSIPIQVNAKVKDDDGDEVIVTWKLIKPRGAGADVELREVDVSEECDGAALCITQEFTPDVPDVWTVEVTADDTHAGGQTIMQAPIPVLEDQPPCIDVTLPAADPERRFLLQRQEGPRTFSVIQVVDELDPYPRPSDAPYLGNPTFAWQLASPDTGGELVPLAGVSGSEVTIDPSVYAPGDLLDLRVEVGDRVERELPCDSALPTCSLTGDACKQRVTWGVEIR